MSWLAKNNINNITKIHNAGLKTASILIGAIKRAGEDIKSWGRVVPLMDAIMISHAGIGVASDAGRVHYEAIIKLIKHTRATTWD